MKTVFQKFVLAAVALIAVFAAATPARADWDDRRPPVRYEGWREREAHEREWREHEWREHHHPRPAYIVQPAPVIVAPPPRVVYAPAPVYVTPAPSYFSMAFNLR